jgi:hypothetical protein
MTPSFELLCSHFSCDRLISGSVGTVIYYGFQCNSTHRTVFLSICLINGLAGTVIPFWDWFDKGENKVCILYATFCHEQHLVDDMYSLEVAHRLLPLFDPLDHVGSYLTTLFPVFFQRHHCFYSCVASLPSTRFIHY